MVNTYKKTTSNDYKIGEELRLIRCILERFLSAKYPSYFLDYQMEKFGPNYKSEK